MENYPYIPAVPERNSVLRRMGYKTKSSMEDVNNDTDEYLKYAGSVFAAKARAEEFDIVRSDKDKFSINGIEINSAQLAKLLKNSARAYIMCATIPQRDVDRINGAIKEGLGLKALAMDAYASEYVDGALDYLMERKNLTLKRTGQKLTKMRFRAGYGDLDIKYQKVFYELLELNSLGVSINEKYLLSPEKSVIAIAGVE
jgi:hypothetical protein